MGCMPFVMDGRYQQNHAPEGESMDGEALTAVRVDTRKTSQIHGGLMKYDVTNRITKR